MTLKNYILGIGLLISPILISAQSVLQIEDMRVDTAHSMFFGIRGEGFTNSSALSGRASNAGLFGGYITPEQRQFMLNRASKANNGGEFLNYTVFFAKRIDSLFGKPRTGLSIFINLSDRQEANSVFSKDALNLVMFGNKQFAGKMVDLAPLGVNQYRYNQFQIGFNKTYLNDVKLGVGISFLYGQNNQSGYAKTFDLYTSNSGDSIYGDLDFYLNQTDPNNANTYAYNGAGASVDISVDLPISLNHRILKDARFKAAIYDLGFISWNGTSNLYDVQGFYEYNGVQIDNIFDNQSNQENLNDYLDSLLQKQTGSYTSFIPATLALELKQEFSSSEAAIGLLYRHNAFYTPFLYGKYGHSLGEKIMATAQLNYGGYGKFGGGLELKYTGKTTDIKIGATNIDGFINPNKWAGQSLYILLGFKL